MNLQRYCEIWHGRRFAWGASDCVQFPLGWVREATGVDHTAGYAYDSEEGARAIIESAGNLEALVSRHLGPMRWPLKGVGPGDVVLTAFDRGQTLGLSTSERIFLLMEERGLIPVQMELARGYWPCL